VNALLLSDVAFDSDDAWGAFQLQHGMMHQKVYDSILDKDALQNEPEFYPLFDFPREDNKEYLFDHWRVHQSNALILGLPGIPDLSTYDLSDPAQYTDFLQQHFLVHLNENIALGIT
jgi:hypothetical protein